MERRTVLDETELKWRIDQARTCSEQILDALVAGTNTSVAVLGDDTEDVVMLALMEAIEEKLVRSDDDQESDDGQKVVRGTLAVAILQLARVERGLPRVTPSPPVD